MAASGDRLRQAARRAAGGVVRDAFERLRTEAQRPPADPSPPAEPGPGAGRSPDEEPGVVFRSPIAGPGEGSASALVIACSSCRFLPHTLEFLEKGLGLAGFDLIAVPGGMQWLALPELLPKHHRVTRRAVEFLLRKHGTRRVIGIAHQGCSAYEDDSTLGALARLATGKTTDEHQRDHLARVGRDLQAGFGVSVELYYASLEGDRSVVFRRIEPGPP